MAIWTKDQSLTERQIIELLLSNDAEFVDSFFKEGCRPMLNRINWKVFGNKMEYTILYENFKFHILQDDWHRLRTFKGTSSLWGWLKITAAHYFYNNRHEFLPELLKPQRPVPDSKKYDFSQATDEEIQFVLDKMSDSTQRAFIECRHLKRYDDEVLVSIFHWSPAQIRKTEKAAYRSLRAAIEDAGTYYERLLIVPEERFVEVGEDEIAVEPSVDEGRRTISKMDVQRALVQLDDRDRYVLRSLIIEDRKRQDVAKELGVTPGYLDIIRNRALKKMKNLLDN